MALTSISGLKLSDGRREISNREQPCFDRHRVTDEANLLPSRNGTQLWDTRMSRFESDVYPCIGSSAAGNPEGWVSSSAGRKISSN